MGTAAQEGGDEKMELDDSGCVQDVGPPPPQPDAAPAERQLLDFGDDVLLYILKFCTPSSLKALGFTCTRFAGLVLDRTLWTRVVDTEQPMGRLRLRWMLAHALHPATTELHIVGYAKEAKGCLGHVKLTREEVEKKYKKRQEEMEKRKSELTSADEDIYAEADCVEMMRLNTIHRLHRIYAQHMNNWGNYAPTVNPEDVVDLDSDCPGPQYTVTPCMLRQLRVQCNLTALSLEYCNLNCSVIGINHFPPTLKWLSMRGTKCYNLPVDKNFLFNIQDYLPELEYLDLSECQWLEPAAFLPLSKVVNLREMNMSHCPRMVEFVAYASLATRYGFRKLRKVDFRCTPVADSEVSALGWLPELEEVYVSPAPALPLNTPIPHSHCRDQVLPPYQELDDWEGQEPDCFKIKPSQTPENPTDAQQTTNLCYHGVDYNLCTEGATSSSKPPEKRSSEDAAKEEKNTADTDEDEIRPTASSSAPNNEPKERPSHNDDIPSKRRRIEERLEEQMIVDDLENFYNRPRPPPAERPRPQLRSMVVQLAFNRPSTSSVNQPSTSSDNQPSTSSTDKTPSTSSADKPPTFSVVIKPSSSSTDIKQPTSSDNQPSTSSVDNEPSTSSTDKPSTSSDNKPSTSSADIKLSTSSTDKSSTSYAENKPSMSSVDMPSTSHADNEPSTSSTDEKKSSNNKLSLDDNLSIDKSTLDEPSACDNRPSTSSEDKKQSLDDARFSDIKLCEDDAPYDKSDSGESSPWFEKPSTSSSNNKPSSTDDPPSDDDQPEVDESLLLSMQSEVMEFSEDDAVWGGMAGLEDREMRQAGEEDGRAADTGQVVEDFAIPEDERVLEDLDDELRTLIETPEGESSKDEPSSSTGNPPRKRSSTNAKLDGEPRPGTSKSNPSGGGPSKKPKGKDSKDDGDDSDDDCEVPVKVYRPSNVNEGASTSQNANPAPHVSVLQNLRCRLPREHQPNCRCRVTNERTYEFVRFRQDRDPVFVRTRAEIIDDLAAARSIDEQLQLDLQGNGPTYFKPLPMNPQAQNPQAQNPQAQNPQAQNPPNLPMMMPQMPIIASLNDPRTPRAHVLYINVGQQQHTVYRLAIQNEPSIFCSLRTDDNDRNRNRADVLDAENMFIAPVSHDSASLVTDAAVRRFGRSDVEDFAFIHIGARHMFPGEPGARPNRSNLRVLSLTGYRNITDRSLVHLATSAPNLQRVDFSNTSVTEQGVQNFKSLRPDCEVIFTPRKGKDQKDVQSVF